MMARLIFNEWKSNKLMMLSVLLFIVAVTLGQSVSFAFLSRHDVIIHTFMIVAAVAVSFSIALHGWLACPFNLSNHQLYISALFFLIGSFRFGHAFALEGMTVWSNASLSASFRIAAGFCESIGIPAILLSREKTAAKGERQLVFGAALALCAIIYTLLLLNHESIPPPITSSTGAAGLMITLEYAVTALGIIALVYIWIRGNRRGRRSNSFRTMIPALVFLLMGAALGSTYFSANEGLRLLGSLYQIAGYYFILQARIRFLGMHDELTELPNRYYFRQMLTDTIARAKAKSRKVGVLLLDIDRFKSVNNSLGHDAGDRILKDLARRLSAPCRDAGGVAARMGGDEFLIMVPNVCARVELERLSISILKQFQAPFQLAGMDVHMTPSIGISTYPDHGKDAETLIKFADIAMFEAKSRRNHYQFYSPETDARSIELLRLENDLRGALERGELTLHYQPLIQSCSGACVGVEALLRWRHPSRGWVPPSDFIPLAEETGLILAIERWALRKSCMQMKSWLDAGADCKRISVNVSDRQFHNAGFYETVCDTLRETGLNPCCLDLEITESVTMVERATAAVLHRLKRLGVRISIDDFGTGYSSLGRLRDLPIDRLKIDRSFIQGIAASEKKAAIVKTMIAMARRLGLAVIAEGVESRAEANLLKRQGCDEMQGFYFSKPLAAEDLERFFLKPANQF